MLAFFSNIRELALLALLSFLTMWFSETVTDAKYNASIFGDVVFVRIII